MSSASNSQFANTNTIEHVESLKGLASRQKFRTIKKNWKGKGGPLNATEPVSSSKYRRNNEVTTLAHQISHGNTS